MAGVERSLLGICKEYLMNQYIEKSKCLSRATGRTNSGFEAGGLETNELHATVNRLVAQISSVSRLLESANKVGF